MATRRLLLVRALRPDRLLQAAFSFVSAVFGLDILGQALYDLGALVSDEAQATTPIALCSVPGHDASYRVDNLVKSTGARCTTVALGSQEGVGLADAAIATAVRSGGWVCLQNVHLAVGYLSILEKRLASMTPSASFRLFLTSAFPGVVQLSRTQWRRRLRFPRRSSAPVECS